jgi:hypothetical protein
MSEPASVPATVRPARVAGRVADRARVLIVTVCACAGFALLPAVAHATAPGLNGPIVEPESTSATACHVVQRQPDGSDPVELRPSCPDFSLDDRGDTAAETDFDGTGGVEILVGGVLKRTIVVADLPSGYGYGNVALSPDGAWVAFELLPSNSSQTASLYVAPTDGSSDPRELIAYVPDTGDGAIALQPAWTPDSQRLVTFSDLDSTGGSYEELVSIDAVSGTVTNLATASEIAPTDHSGDWFDLPNQFVVRDVSPDGTRVLVDTVRFNGGGYEERLFEVNLGSTSATRVSNSEYDLPQSLVAGAVYSPDGTEIAVHVLDESTDSPFNGEYLVLHRLHDTVSADDVTVPVLATASSASTGHMVWEVEDAGPDITSGPDDTTTNSRSATFEFVSEVDGATFQCSLDNAAFTTCSSPITYQNLMDGQHTFRVRSVAPDQSVSAPSERDWTVDTQAPVALIDSAPSGTGNPANATIVFHGSKFGVEFTCTLDDQAPYACGSPQNLAGLAPGPHVFTITATDALGNTSSTPTVVTWSVGGGSNLPPASTCTGHSTASASSGLLFMVGRAGTCLTSATVAGQPVWTATGPVTVNGILVTPDPGAAVTLSAAGGAGRLATTGPASVQLGTLPPHHFDSPLTFAQDAAGLLKPAGVLTSAGIDLVKKVAGLDVPSVWPTIDLSSDDGGTAKITLTITLPDSFTPLPAAPGTGEQPKLSGNFVVTASNDKGVSWGAGIHIAKAWLGLFTVKNLDLAYDSASDAFTGSFGVDLQPDGPELVLGATIGGPPTPALWGCCLQKLAIALQDLHKEIPDTPLFLEKVGGAFSRETGTVAGRPQSYLKLTGSAGLSLGPTIPELNDLAAMTFDGTAALSFSDPWVLEVSGQASILQFPLADAKLTYTDGVGAVVTGHVDETIAGFGFSAQITNTFFQGRSQFNIEGSGLINLGALGSQSANVIFSNKGFAACTKVHGLFSDSAIGWGVDANGHQVVLAGSCDLGPYRVAAAASHTTAAGTPRVIRLVAHHGMRLLAVHGAGGAPSLTVTGPGGLRLISGPTGTRTARGIIIIDNTHATTFVLLPGGRAARYTITSSDRTILGVGEADSLPPVRLRVSSHPAHGGRRVLTWSQQTVPGQRLELFEQGAGGTGRLLLTTATARGHLTYTPQLGIGPKRSVLAVTLERGMPRVRQIVARYRVIDSPPGKVRGLMAKGRRLRWRATSRATHYMVAFATPGASRSAITTRGLTLRIPSGATSATAVALDALGRPGPTVTLRLHPARSKPHPHGRATTSGQQP